jgi:ATP-binding cassette subfamily G (WHITE) protein 2 (PDR)
MGLFRNARWTGTVHTRSTLVFLVIWSAFLFGSTLAHALIAGAPTAEAASALGNVLGILVSFHPSFNDRKESLTATRCTLSPAS